MQNQSFDISSVAALIISALSLVISIFSYFFSRKSWQESNRPLITVRTSSFGEGGNMAIPLSLVIKNTGNRPAKNIRLSVEPQELEKAYRTKTNSVLKPAIERCFSESGIIPALDNGESVSNSFGFLSGTDESTWVVNSVLNVKVSYEDSDGRNFESQIPIRLADDAGFADSHWSSSKNKS